MRRNLSRVGLAVATTVILASQAQATSRRTPIVEAVEKTKNAVVTIKVEKSSNGTVKNVTGTGVIIDERGYVVTNNHVIANAESLGVVLYDGTVLMSKIAFADADHDLAVLQVRGQDGQLPKLQTATLGSGNDLLLGETVIAIGHPLGYRNTVSTGIVSATGREIDMPSGAKLVNLIQTNASINPGNSGGPLLNINGELIGINVAVRDGAQGIAFALNIEMVKEVLSQKLAGVQVAAR